MSVQVQLPNTYPIPQKPDFAGMYTRVTAMTAKMTLMRTKVMMTQIRVMMAPKPPGLPFTIALNFTSILKSFTNQLSFMGAVKNLIKLQNQNWGPPNVRP